MSNTSPTIVTAKLDDQQLKDSVNQMVEHFNKSLEGMVAKTQSTVQSIQNELQKIGKTKFDTNESSDSGASKRTKEQDKVTEAIERTVAAQDKQVKKNQEVATSFDNFAKAQQVAVQSQSMSRNSIEILNNLRAQLQFIESEKAKAAKNFGSLFAMPYDQQADAIRAKIREITQGVSVANSEQKQVAISVLQTTKATEQQIQTAQRYTEEIRKQAAAIRATKEWQEKGHVLFGDVNYYDKERANVSKRDKQLLLSLEEQIVQAQQKEAQEALAAAKAKRQQAQATKEAANTIKSVSYKTDLQMSLSGFGVKYTQDVTNEQVKQYQTIEEQLQKLKTSYALMNEEAKKSEQGLGISKSISELQRQRTELLQSIAQQISKKQTSAATDQFSSLRQSISSVLGVQSENVRLFDAEKASSEQLSKELKMLQSAYSKLSASRIAKGDGTAIADEIQRVQRALQKLQATQTRPTSLKSVMGLDEKTLDDIAYKMQRLSSYRSGLDTNAQHNEIRRVNYEYDVLKKKMDEVMQKNSQMISSNTALGRSWNYMKNRLAFYFTVGASTQFIKNLIEVRSQYEMNERALGILVDSAERGTQIFRELSDMALVSPYTLIELSSAAKQLTAYDVAAKDVVDTTRRLADMASAVGVPVERLTYALGQIKAYGYLNSRDARMFANAGIPLVKELADHYTTLEGRLVSTADVYDRIKKKAIDYNDVMQVMNEMTDEGGKFYDFQAKMADTLKVQLANLTLAWNNMLNDLGNSQQGLLTGGIGALKELFLHWKDLDRILTNLAVTIGTAKAAQLLLNMSFGKGTLAAIKNISAIEGNTAAMYENALSKSNLSKAEARWLVSTNRSNVALRAAMVNMKLLTVEEANAAASTTVLGVRMGWLGRVMKTNFFGLASVVRGAAVGMEMLGKAMLSIVTNPVFLTITAAMALVDALLYYNQIAEKTAEMNKAIADNAKEASEAIGDYLKDSVNIGNRAKAAQGVLSVSEGQKAWESIREQIELSSDAASVFISKLLEEEDINKRVKEGFDVAESIREATNAMAGLNSEALKVSQDSWLWGAFGEGLAEDLEDYIEAVQRGRKNGANIGSRYFAAGERKEAMDELTAFANDAETIIRDRLGAGVKDAVQLKEAIERVKKEVIAANPQIKGEVKKWFDVEVDRMMAERFGGVYNELSSIQSQFIEHIKHDSGAALRRLSDDILDTSKELDDDVLGAISKAWDKLKDELPAESQDLISKLQKQMDENPLTLRVLLLQAGEQQIRDSIQKDYEKHFYDANIGEKPTRPKDVGSLWGDYKGDYDKFAAAQEKHEKEMVEYNQKNAEWEAKRAEYVAKYGDFNKKNDETRAKWAKRVNDEIKAADAEEKAAKHARESLEAELSLEERKTDARYLSAVQEEQAAKDRKSAAQEAWNYEKLYQEEKEKGRKGSKKDPLLDALKQEISLVEKLQSDYDKLSKSGASQADALDTIRGAYGKTIRLLNTQLQSYGLPQIDISQLITGKDPNKALAHFKQTLDTLVSKGMLTLERSKVLEAVVDKFTLSAKTYNLDMITKGLNNELGKIKDEYELAIELDANPELGDMFTKMFGLDTTGFPKTIDEYMSRVQQEFDKMRKDRNFSAPLNIFKAGNKEWEEWGRQVGLVVDVLDENGNVINKNTDALDILTPKFKEAQNVAKKWAQDTLKSTQDLQYKLADNNAKIAIEEEKLAVLRQRLAQETNDKQKALLELQIQDQQNAINKLKEEILQLLPTYNRLFGEVAEHSAAMTRKLARDYKNMLVDAQKRGKNPGGTYTVIDPVNGKSASVTKERLGKEIKNANKELGKTDNVFKKIKESLTKGEDGIIDWVGGIENIGEAIGQVGDLVDTIGNVYDMFGNPNEYDATSEALHDIATSMQGVNTAAKGIGQIASGDYIGGAMSVISGLSSAIGTWFDNGDKEILQQIKDSERAVKQLELAYKNLEFAIENAYGANVIGAKQAAIANKELQLAELNRQLALEKSRDGKDRDEDKIVELQGQIIDLQNDIKRSMQEITTELLGISSVGDAALSFMDAYISALRKGEDAQKAFTGSWKEMIANMIKQLWVTKVIGPQLEALVDDMNKRISERSKTEANAYEKAVEEQTKRSKLSDDEIRRELAKNHQDVIDERYKEMEETQKKAEKSSLYRGWYQIAQLNYRNALWGVDTVTQEEIDAYRAEGEKVVSDSKKALDKATMPTINDLDLVAQSGKDLLPLLQSSDDDLNALLERYGLFEDQSNKTLSALQQGIQGITEDTAGALEAYMNGVSQQVYLQSDLLTQIRDAVVGLNADVQLATQAQILLQLQQSYAVQMAIQGILAGVLNPSGRAFVVELNS